MDRHTSPAVQQSVAEPHPALPLLCVLGALAPLNIAPIDGDTYLAALVRPVLILQLVIGAAVGFIAWRDSRAGDNISSRLPLALRFSSVALVACVWLSAALSEHRLIGVAGAATVTAVVMTIVATAWVVRTPDDAATIIRWIVIGACVAAVFGLAVLASGQEFWDTQRFRGSVTRLGLRPRLTRPWAHANVAGMAIGVALSLTVGLRFRWRWLAVPTVLLLAGSLIFTYSRGALVATVVAAIVGAMVLRSRTGFTALGLLIGLLAAAVLITPGWADRFDADVAARDFAATVEPPTSIELGPAGSTVEVLLVNDSTLTWRSSGPDMVELSARWLDQDNLVVGEQRWPLEQDVRPGASLLMAVPVSPVTTDGTYQVLWDLLLDQEAYFLQFSDRSAPSVAVVVESPVLETVATPLVPPRINISRATIWRMARDVFFDRPLFGVGPLQLVRSVDDQLDENQRFPGAHAHNLVLEPLATWGLLGTLPFLVLVIGGLWRAGRWAWAVGAGRWMVGLSVFLGLMMICLHSMVEWPLAQVGMALPFSLLLGIAWSVALPVDGQLPVDGH